MNARNCIVAGGVLGCLSVTLGAFGAHGLPDRLVSLGIEAAEIPRRLEIFQTAARYQIYTATALLFLGLFALHSPGRLKSIAGWLLLVGCLIFSGLLNALTFAGDDMKWLGAMVPIGGAMMIAGWALIAVCGWRFRYSEESGQATRR